MEEFLPKSPDPRILTQADQTLARFGHLNTLIRELNSLPVYLSNADAITAGLKPGELFVLSSTKAVTQVQ